MCNWNQHLVLLIQVDLVQRDFLMDTNEIPNKHLDFHDLHKNISYENNQIFTILLYKVMNLDLRNKARRGPEGQRK